MEGGRDVCFPLSRARRGFMRTDGRRSQKNLQEAIVIQLEETKKLGTLNEFLEGAGFSPGEKTDLLKSSKNRLIHEEITIPLAA